MNLSSHWIFSRKLVKSSPFPISFAQKCLFRFGNLWPDISGSFMKHPHTPAVMYDTIESTIASQIKNIQNGYAPSHFKMGVVTHYLADFFCSAHNQPFGEDVHRHYCYEKKLHLFIQVCSFPQTYDLCFDGNRLCSDLKQLHSDFANQAPTCENDTAYIINACRLFYLSAHYLMNKESSYSRTLQILPEMQKNF